MKMGRPPPPAFVALPLFLMCGCGADRRRTSEHDDGLVREIAAEDATRRHAGGAGKPEAPPLNSLVLRDLAEDEIMRAFGRSWTAVESHPEWLILELTRLLGEAEADSGEAFPDPRRRALVRVLVEGRQVGAWDMDLGKLRAALKDPVLREDVNSFVRSYLLRGLGRLSLGDSEGALKDFEKALAKEPKNAQGLLGRGMARLDRGDNEEAMSDLAESIRIDSGNGNAHFARSLAHFRKREFDAAVAAVDRALALTAPDSPRRAVIEGAAGHMRAWQSRQGN